jgi:hypothetical protein
MSHFEHKLAPDGSTNPKYVDLLEEDKPIAQQKFVCVSFVSPEKEIKAKEMYFFEEFLKGWDLSKSVEKFSEFVAFISYKYNLDVSQINEDLSEFCKEEVNKLREESVSNDYKTFVDNNEERLDNQYNQLHNFQTCTRGLKIRGIYPTQEEAELRAKLLRETDQDFDVYVGPVGIWMPWDPEAYKTGRVEYLEEELNELMAKKNKNETKAKDYFDNRVKDAKKQAIEDNKKKAEETGNKLTQNITSKGDLVGVKNTNTQETILEGTGEEVTSADVRKELFTGDNIVTTQTDHGLSELSGVQMDVIEGANASEKANTELKSDDKNSGD